MAALAADASIGWGLVVVADDRGPAEFRGRYRQHSGAGTEVGQGAVVSPARRLQQVFEA